jgi:hypothetical protein
VSESAPIREMKRRSIPSRCARPTSGQSGFNGARQRSAGGGRCSRAVSARADQRARRSRTHSITMIMMWGASAAAFRAEAAWDSDNTASSGPRVDIIGSYALGAARGDAIMDQCNAIFRSSRNSGLLLLLSTVV